jgi:hypothetical protein
MDAVSDLIVNDLTDPQAAFDALDAALERPRLDSREEAPKAKPGESSRAYVVREQAWREEHDLPRKRAHKAPSQQPDGRRLQYIRTKAKRLGITVEEAATITRVHTRHVDAW